MELFYRRGGRPFADENDMSRTRRTANPVDFAWKAALGIALIGPVVRLAAAPAAEAPVSEAKPSQALPSEEQVTGAIEQHFRGKKNFEPGDLIQRSDVQGALDRVAKLGWEIPQRERLEKLVLPDDAFLVVQLQSKAGTRFMRKVSRYPGAYDRLDRLSGIAGGRRIINDLIRDKGGHELIEYLSTSEGGANLGRMLSNAKDGSDLNKPTGRLYTVESLLKVVTKLYADQSARASAGELP
jgi:hypothetical protein